MNIPKFNNDKFEKNQIKAYRVILITLGIVTALCGLFYLTSLSLISIVFLIIAVICFSTSIKMKNLSDNINELIYEINSFRNDTDSKKIINEKVNVEIIEQNAVENPTAGKKDFYRDLINKNQLLFAEIQNIKSEIKKYVQVNTQLLKENADLKNKLNELNADSYFEVKNKLNSIEQDIASAESKRQSQSKKINDEIEYLLSQKERISQLNYTVHSELEQAQAQLADLENKITTANRKLRRTKELCKSLDYATEHFINNDFVNTAFYLDDDFKEAEFLAPSVILKLNCMDIKSLRQAYTDNEKTINHLLKQYSGRYSTKANQTIYDLMVIALRSELQNILWTLKYEKLDSAVENVKKLTAKYFELATQGNQTIAPTLTRFIGEIEYLFVNAVKIEYNYYVKKEQAHQEQLALKQQMREEAEERKLLAQQQEQIEKEELKFKNEISKLTDIAANATDNEEIELLNKKISELQAQLSDITTQKEEIVKLQNGKAGNVYIISNLGSFGESIFKIGMTRRINPQERIDELSSASVPFKFDVHSFIFSDDAVSLENNLHKILNERRVNKVNLRKEFFNISIDELEELINKLAPTAAFNKTMLATEFRQSLSSDNIYTNEYSED